jgi:hypothetical protein
MTMLDPHLDVDQLSAAVDGAQDPATSAHLLTCLACREQVDVWRRSLGELKDLATVDDQPAPDDAIAAALAEWRAPITPLAPARTRRQRRWPSVQLVAAAAVIVVVFGGVFALAKLGGSSGDSSSASSGGASATAQAPVQHAGVGTSTKGAGTPTKRNQAGGSTGASASASGSQPDNGSATFGFASKATLASHLKAYTRSHGSSSGVPASTPCLKAAKTAAVRVAATASGGPAAPAYLVPVEYRGVGSRAFVFDRTGGYVAFVLTDTTCALVTRVDF